MRSRTVKDARRKRTDARVKDAALYFLPVTFRVPFKFGADTLTRMTCARVCVRVENAAGRQAEGWVCSPHPGREGAEEGRDPPERAVS